MLIKEFCASCNVPLRNHQLQHKHFFFLHAKIVGHFKPWNFCYVVFIHSCHKPFTWMSFSNAILTLCVTRSVRVDSEWQNADNDTSTPSTDKCRGCQQQRRLSIYLSICLSIYLSTDKCRGRQQQRRLSIIKRPNAFCSIKTSAPDSSFFKLLWNLSLPALRGNFI